MSEAPKSVVQKGKKLFACVACEKLFSTSCSAYRHMRCVHQAKLDFGGKMLCPLCSQGVRTRTDLFSHLQDVHQESLTTYKLLFSTRGEFEIWKTKFEKDTRASFVKACGEHKLSDGSTSLRYRCSREGVYQDHVGEKRKHRMKRTGTNKIGAACPAFITCNVGEFGLVVDYCPTHLGHYMELGRLELTKEDRLKIAGLLAQGLPYEKILEQVRTNYTGPNVERIHLLSKEDLRNIKKDLCRFHTGRFHEDDEVSTDYLVKSLSASSENPVLFYKPHGLGDENEILLPDDFCLILMSSFQKEMLDRFGDTKICIDSITETNKYEFFLHIIFVEDEFYYGCPVAFCISNREDKDLCALFFDKVKLALGKGLDPPYIMADDEKVYFDVWLDTMGSGSQLLLCNWYVEKRWQDQLEGSVGSTDKKAAILKRLQEMVLEKHRSTFESRLNAFLLDLDLDAESSEFSKLFRDQYAHRPEAWAMCYRPRAGVCKKTPHKGIHHLLKHISSALRKNERVDSLVIMLLKVTKDAYLKHLLRSEASFEPVKEQEILQEHEKSSRITDSMITKLEVETNWQVRSADDENLSYVVSRQVNPLCKKAPKGCLAKQEQTLMAANQKKCFFCCGLCNVCMHEFYCTCPSNILSANICEHIHACVRKNLPAPVLKEETSSLAESSRDSVLASETEETPEPTVDDIMREKLQYLMDLAASTPLSDADKNLFVAKLNSCISFLHTKKITWNISSTTTSKNVLTVDQLQLLTTCINQASPEDEIVLNLVSDTS